MVAISKRNKIIGMFQNTGGIWLQLVQETKNWNVPKHRRNMVTISTRNKKFPTARPIGLFKKGSITESWQWTHLNHTREVIGSNLGYNSASAD
jgi:hypothetical protein